jgi:hypothetical protein
MSSYTFGNRFAVRLKAKIGYCLYLVYVACTLWKQVFYPIAEISPHWEENKIQSLISNQFASEAAKHERGRESEKES